MSDTYDEQIEALLSGDVSTYYKLVGDYYRRYDRYDLERPPTFHFTAWNVGGDYPDSIFSKIGETGRCASQIEYSRRWWGAGKIDAAGAKIKAAVMKGSTVSLPRLANPFLLRKTVFTREQLEEFARRQRAAAAYAEELESLKEFTADV